MKKQIGPSFDDLIIFICDDPIACMQVFNYFYFNSL